MSASRPSDCYGGPIDTPNIDAIAADGVRFQQWHTTALCSPTRSCLLTGRNHTRNSMACITEAAIGFPNASGTIPPENGTISEILGELGWNTYMVGKWHLCPDDEMNLASTRRNWPTGRGFERWYGFLGAETNQWYPDLVYDNHTVDQPATPEDGYHLTVDLTDKAIEFIHDAKAIAPEKPFFLYYTPGACHAPHHAPKAWIDKYKGRFDQGYEALRAETLARQKEMGIVPAEARICRRSTRSGRRRRARDPTASRSRRSTSRSPWDSLTADEQALFARMAEVYAGFLGHADSEIGRLLGFLEEFGWRENTMVVVVSDNGASGEGGPNGSVNEMKFANGIPDTMEANLPLLDLARQPDHLQPLPERLGNGFQYAVQNGEALRFNGGTSDPCIMSWPTGGGRGEIRHSITTPSISSRRSSTSSGSSLPALIKGHRQTAFNGVSMRYSFDPSAPTARRTQFYSMLGSRGIWHDGWKAVTNHPTLSGWSNFNDDEWELYH